MRDERQNAAAKRAGRVPLGLALVSLVSLAAPRDGEAQSAGAGWEYDGSERGVSLYVAESKAHSYDVLKAVATLDAAPLVLVAVLRDIGRYPRWYHDCIQTRVLNRPSELAPLRVDDQGRFLAAEADESYVLFFRQRAPPLDDRWAIIENRMRTADGSLIIDFRSLDRYAYRAPADAVRMRVRGRWVLSPLSARRTRVSLVVDVDPDTTAPAFLVDPNLHAMVINTVANLRREAAARQRSSGRPAPRGAPGGVGSAAPRTAAESVADVRLNNAREILR